MAFYYNQSEAVPNIPGKREHNYRRRFTDVPSPDFFLREEGTSVHRLTLALSSVPFCYVFYEPVVLHVSCLAYITCVLEEETTLES